MSKRLSDQQKAAIVARIQSGGSTIKDEAKAADVSAAIVRMWVKKYGKQAANTVATPTQPVAEAPTTATAPIASAREKLALAKAVLGGGVDVPQSDNTTPPPPPQVDPTEGLIQLCDAATMIGVKAISAAMRVPMDDEIRKASRLSDEEKDQLRPFAPSAAPYIQELIAQSGKIAAAAFAMCYGLIVYDRFNLIKGKRPKKLELKPEQKPEAAA